MPRETSKDPKWGRTDWMEGKLNKLCAACGHLEGLGFFPLYPQFEFEQFWILLSIYQLLSGHWGSGRG